MQEKKRAKSVNFGKTLTDKPEKQKVIEKKSIAEPEEKQKRTQEQTYSSKISEKTIDKKSVETLSTKVSSTNSQESPDDEFFAVNITTHSNDSSSVEEPQTETEEITMTASTVEEFKESADIKEEKVHINHTQTSLEGDTGVHKTVFDSPEGTEQKKKNYFGRFLLISIISFMIGLVSMTGINFAFENKAMSILNLYSNNPKPPSTLIKPIKVPEKTPLKKVNLSAYTIKVLNGSGISGEAAKVKSTLVAAGFTVVSLGNADTSDYTKTQIAAKKTVDEGYITKLNEILQKTYSIESVSQIPAGSSPDADVVVTIGSAPAK